MQKTWLVLKNEFRAVVLRPSFLIILVLIPLAGFLVTYVIGLVQTSPDTAAAQTVENIFTSPQGDLPEGYVDHSGLIIGVPDEISSILMQYPTEAAAQGALMEDKIQAYYIIPDDYITSGQVVAVRKDVNPIQGFEQSGVIETLIAYNLLGSDPQVAQRYLSPASIKAEAVEPQPIQREQGVLAFFLPYIVTFLFYIVIISSASLMLSSVTNEKQNRMMEILMTSVSPVQLLTGKIIALGAVGLLQTMVWSRAGLLLLRISGRAFSLPPEFQLPTSILIWGALFFIFGYAVYAGLMAAVGALVPNLKEASQATTIIIIPLIVPLVLLSALINAPNSGLSIALSLFPLTSPVSMMTRLAATSVPFWQSALALLLLAVTAVLVVRGAAGMFRAQNLLVGQTFKLKTFLMALVGKA